MVFLNLVAMCFRRFDSTPQEIMRLEYTEMAFTVFFFVEICVRIVGHSTWKLFWKRKTNKFDLFLALTTVILQIPAIQRWEWFRYLTIFQVLRAYRLIPAIPGVRELMVSVLYRPLSRYAACLRNTLIRITIWLTPVCPISNRGPSLEVPQEC